MMIRFTGPSERRALVVTGSSPAWDEWRKVHAAEYSAAFWLLDEGDLCKFMAEAFEVIRLC